MSDVTSTAMDIELMVLGGISVCFKPLIEAVQRRNIGYFTAHDDDSVNKNECVYKFKLGLKEHFFLYFVLILPDMQYFGDQLLPGSKKKTKPF